MDENKFLYKANIMLRINGRVVKKGDPVPSELLEVVSKEEINHLANCNPPAIVCVGELDTNAEAPQNPATAQSVEGNGEPPQNPATDQSDESNEEPETPQRARNRSGRSK